MSQARNTSESTSPIQDESKLYTLPGFKMLPKKIVVSELSKKLFDEGREMPAYKYLGGQRGQGFVVIAWKNKIDEEDILQIELVPAFNKDDNKPRTNKNDKPYIMFNPEAMPELKKEEWENVAVESPESLGQNSGAVHQYAIEVLKQSGRIPKDLSKTCMFGLGIFKGGFYNQPYLLADFRNRSANINSESVKYNREYELMHYSPENGDYYIKRALPFDISEKIYEAITQQLSGKDGIITCLRKEIHNATTEKTWNEDNNSRIELLFKVLDDYLKNSPIKENKLVEEIIFYIKRIQTRLNTSSFKLEILQTAIENDCSAAIISQLLAAEATPYFINKKGHSAFDIAKYLGRENILKQLNDFHHNCLMSLSNHEKLIKLICAGEIYLKESQKLLESKISIRDPSAGKTPLALAVMKNSQILTQLILDQYEEKSISEENTDLLQQAIKFNNEDLVKLLLKYHANLNLATFMESIAIGNDKIIQLLLTHKIFSDKSLINQKINGKTLFLEAVLKENYSLAENLLDIGADINDTYKYSTLLDVTISTKNPNVELICANCEDKTLLEVAILTNNIKLVEFLLNHKVKIDQHALETAINKAMEKGNTAILELLLEHGAANSLNDNASKLIHFAATYNKTNMMRILSNKEYKLDLNCVNQQYGETAAHFAAERNNHEILRILYDAGASLDLPNKYNSTPLELSILRESDECAKFLITNTVMKCSPYENYRRLINIIVSNRSTEILKLLLDTITTPVFIDIYDNVFYKAAELGYVDGLRCMLQPHYKIDINQNVRTYGDTNNITAAIGAAGSNHAEALQLLIEAKADLYKTTQNGNTALHWAAKENADKTTLLLLNNKMPVDIRNPITNETPAFIASTNNQLNVLKILTEAKADLLMADINGMTPLHIAAKNGHTNIVRFLLNQGAKANLDNNNHTPLYYAIQHKHWSLVKYFINYNQLNATDKQLIQTFKQEISWNYYETSLASATPGQAPIIRLLMKSTSLFHKLQDDYLVENRHKNERLQGEHDKAHGLIPYQTPSSLMA